MNFKGIAQMASVGALTLAATSAFAGSDLPPVGVGPAPFVAFKDTSSASILSGHAYATIQNSYSTTTGTGTYLPCVAGTVTLEFGGAGSAVSGQLERSDTDPSVVANPQPVGSAQSGSNPSSGVAPVTATEGGYGWWAYKVTASTGVVTVSVGCTIH